MKLAFVHRKYTRAGGVEKNVVLLAEGMAARGHEVHVFCHRAERAAADGVRIRHVPVWRLGSAAKYLSFASNAARMVRAEPFDVVQGFDLTWEQDVLRIGRGLVEVYRDVLEGVRNPVQRLWRHLSPGAIAMKRIERRMLAPGAFRKVVAISRSVERELLACGVASDAIEVVYNGVDLARFAPAAAEAGRDAARARFGISAGERVVLFVGTGFRRKGLDTLLDAFARLARGQADLRLLVVGRDGRAGSYRARARDLGVADRVVFAGRQPVDAALYGAADVVALPTRYEPFGNVVLEALASGRPAVVSRAAGASEVLDEAFPSWILPDADDAGGLAGRLATVLANPPSATDCRAVAERYGDEACLDRYEAIYRAIAGTTAVAAPPDALVRPSTP